MRMKTCVAPPWSCVVLALGVLAAAPALAQAITAETSGEVTLAGQVTSTADGAMEGVVVTAKREGSTIAVSVISDADGRYRFPADSLEAGSHVLSIRAVGYDLDGPRAAEVGASGTTTVDLTLRPTLDVEAQLTNAEWLESIPGTDAQKGMFDSCVRCHTIDRVMRSRYDAEAWLHVLERMDGYVTSAFPGNPQRLPAGRVTPFSERSEERQLARRRQADYLASINLSSGTRGYALETFPRPTRRATRVVITEYDLPDRSRAPHDAEVDPDGMVWYPDFGQQYLGRLDPRTGEVTEYQVPEARPGNPTGILALRLDRDGNPWGGNMFQGSIFKFDRRMETFQVWKVPDELEQPSGAHGTRIFQVNHAAPERSHVDGKVWLQNRSIAGVHRLDLATGEFETFEPFLGSRRRSHNLYGISPDSQNNLWFMDFTNEHIGRIDARTGDITLYETPTLGSPPTPRDGRRTRPRVVRRIRCERDRDVRAPDQGVPGVVPANAAYETIRRRRRQERQRVDGIDVHRSGCPTHSRDRRVHRVSPAT